MNCKRFGESQNPGHRARRSGCLGCGCRDERELYPDLGIRLLFHPVIMERAGDRSGQVKGRSPRSAEGEEARLCGGLWTKFITKPMVPAANTRVNTFSTIFEKKSVIVETTRRRMLHYFLSGMSLREVPLRFGPSLFLSHMHNQPTQGRA